MEKEASEMYDKWCDAKGIEKFALQGCILSKITRLRILANSPYCRCDSTCSIDEIYKNSSKIKEIVSIINDRLVSDKSNSVVVFTQFVSYIKLLEKVISDKVVNVKVYKYTGECSLSERDILVKKFRTSTKRRVLLISLFAGGVGLTLLPCATVIMCEPWYNPFVEKQAEERVHRIGQDKQVYIYRITMYKSIEKWIQQVKLKKIQCATEIGLQGSMSKVKISSTFSMNELKEVFDNALANK